MKGRFKTFQKSHCNYLTPHKRKLLNALKNFYSHHILLVVVNFSEEKRKKQDSDLAPLIKNLEAG